MSANSLGYMYKCCPLHQVTLLRGCRLFPSSLVRTRLFSTRPRGCEDLPLAKMHRDLSLWCSRDDLLQSLELVSISGFGQMQDAGRQTSLSKTHLFKGLSHPRQFHICWLCRSRHCQCDRNSSRQFLLMSSSLHIHISTSIGVPTIRWRLVGDAYTLAAHRVTFRPSFMQSSSPLPFASCLHTM